MVSDPNEATLVELEQKLAEEERIYAELLERLDALAANAAPFARDPRLPGLLAQLNEAVAPLSEEERTAPGGLLGLVRRLARKLLEPELASFDRAFERQRRFQSTLVQFLNGWSENANAAAARTAEFSSVLVGFAQRIDRLVDAKDRLYASIANRRCDLLLEAMDKRLETVRLALWRAEERLEGTSAAVALARAEVGAFGGASVPPRESPERAERLEEARYVAFEDRFRGSPEEIRRRLTDYVPVFRDRGPVLDLGCGRGEFLDLLRDAGIEASGVDGNSEMVRLCRERGLTVEHGDVIAVVAGREPGSLGGVFAAQLIEHLPPRLLGSFLENCYRALRPGGRLVLETVNPRSLLALVESFYRDLTHEKPLHPDTLDFALRAAGFREVSTRYASPVPARARLLPVGGDDGVARTLNQNFEKLNAFLFGEQDYAAVATKE